MRTIRLVAWIAVLIFLSSRMFAQNVKIAKVGLGMSETEIKEALGPSTHFIVQSTGYSDLQQVIAQTEAESFALTFIDDKLERSP